MHSHCSGVVSRWALSLGRSRLNGVIVDVGCSLYQVLAKFVEQLK